MTRWLDDDDDDDDASITGQSSADLVIVGAGTSCMGMLYGLLSKYIANATVPFTITVIDPGIGDDEQEEKNDDISQRPHRWFRAAHDSAAATTIHQGITSRRRVIDIPIGSGRGGTSRINATLCIPPRRQDFDSWPEPWKTQVMASVGIVQETMYANSALHVSHAAGAASNQFHLPNPYIPSVNNDPISWKETVFPSVAHHLPCTVHPKYLTRRNYYDGLLEPLLQKHSHLAKCINWVQGNVERLLFQGDRVIGVEYSARQSCAFHVLHATHEVILCAGAIETPALLLVSGVGLADDVMEQRFRNYPGGVGRKLGDHVMLPRAILVPKSSASSSLNGVQSLYQLEVGRNLFQVAIMDAVAFQDILPRLVAGLFRYRFARRGFLSAFMNQVSRLLFNVAESIIVVLLYFPLVTRILCYHLRVVATFYMNPPASGQVRVAVKPGVSADAALRRSDYDLDVDLDYAASTQSLEALLEGWVAADAVCPEGLEIFPGRLVRRFFSRSINRDRFERFATSACLPYFHWFGTCSMMIENGDDQWVVDSSLRLRGITGLRICDASVIPTPVAAPTGLVCAAIGHTFGSNMLYCLSER